MTWLRSPPVLFVVLTLVAAAVLAGIWLLPQGSPFLLPVSLGGVVALGWLIDRCWKRLDEAAKAAQQAAWFWGGSTGMGLALGILSPPHGRLFSPPELPPDTLMFGGGLFVIAGGIVGWLIAWGAWWLRHR